MKLSLYLNQKRGRQSMLAREIGAHAPDVSRWADGTRPIPVAHAAAIERASGGLVTRQEMFPNDWQSIWPELSIESNTRRATDPLPAPGHAGRQPPSPTNILDTIPPHSVVLPAIPKVTP